jgi:alpha-galactosidase
MSGSRTRAVRGALAVLACAVTGLASAPAALALDDGLARTPPMGFNNWNATHCRADFNEDMVKGMADLFVSSGLKDAGYEYVNLDDCWALPERDAEGRLVPDPVRFPNGIKAVADYVHSKGLKIGIYTSAGTKTCNQAGFPGALGHEYEDAAQFASWGIDYLKYDNCNNQGVDAIQRYTKMRDALKATGRKIVYSICEWGQNDPWLWAEDVGHLWRTTGDISDNYASMLNIVHQNMELAEYAGPGHWNDPDMLEVGNGGMTDIEYRSHFSLWAIMAAPLLIGSDLRDATPETFEILENREVIRVDQDRLGVQGRPISTENGHNVFVKPLRNGDVAVALFNETDAPARISTNAIEAGLPQAPAYKLRDLWAKTTRETAGEIAANVPAHGTAMFRVGRDLRWYEHPPAVDAGLAVGDTVAGETPLAEPGETLTVTTTATNAGRNAAHDVTARLTAPDGWRVTPKTATVKPTLTRNAPFRTRWSVEVPEDAAIGEHGLGVDVTYRSAGSRRELRTGFEIAVRVPQPPPSGTFQLSGAAWLSATNGYGPVEIDTSNGESDAGDGNPITIAGRTYERGLGAHSPGAITYYLGRECSSFTTDVGLDDEEGDAGTVTFEVWVDGEKVADSGVMTQSSPAQTLAADVTGARLLRLVVTDAGDGNSNDHADWAAPQLTCSFRPPPAGTSQLSDLSWQSAANGWGPVERDRSVGSQEGGDGQPLTIGGEEFEKGLGAHAPSAIEYHLGGACSAVRAVVGVDDEVDSAAASVTFEIWADDAKVADSGVLRADAAPLELTADVSDATSLRLVVTDAGDGKNSDHADWADARLTCA